MADNIEELNQHVRTCIGVFVTLLCLTILTVAVSYLDYPPPATISIALSIAFVKASIVVSYFMHLISEKDLVYWSLGITAAFFLILMVVPIATNLDITTQMIEVSH